MTDVNGRTVSVGDKSIGGTVIALTTLNGSPAFQVQYDFMAIPMGYTVRASAGVTAPPGFGGDSGWWTCFPSKCIP